MTIERLAQRLQEMKESGQLPAYLLDEEREPRPPLLSSFDEAGVAEYIHGLSGRDIVVLGGAGMSTSAGIPDFRSPGTGLYDNLQKYDLPRPQAIFEINYFRERPQAFYELARELWPGAYSPTPTHALIRLLDRKERLLRCFTQNIDSLESAAGVPYERCVAAHGNFDSATCIDTGEKVPIDRVKEALLESADGWRRLRDEYGGLVKPDIVFFGEGLPARFFQHAEADLATAKLLLVIGTSLSVQPFASLINKVSDDCVRVLINRDPVGVRDRRIPAAIAAQLNIGNGFEFFQEDNYRDVALLGNCDDVTTSLAAALGWESDLQDLIRTQQLVHPRLERQRFSRQASTATVDAPTREMDDAAPPLSPTREDNDNEEDDDTGTPDAAAAAVKFRSSSTLGDAHHRGDDEDDDDDEGHTMMTMPTEEPVSTTTTPRGEQQEHQEQQQ